jgi:plastocyanin
LTGQLRKARRRLAEVFVLCIVAMVLFAQQTPEQQLTVSGRVLAENGLKHAGRGEKSSIVVWLEPLDRKNEPPVRDVPAQRLTLTQKGKTFEPHLLVVQVGSVVDFPNRDPFFHNVFSLFDGKRFDLGLYEAGTTRHVRFDRPGVCYIFCNIHPEMSAVVIVLDTPYYAIASGSGSINIPNVPSGRYQLHVWDERSLPETLSEMTREVTLSSAQPSLGMIHIREADLPLAHTNKYGRDYDKPAPSSPGYIPQ